MVNCSSRPPGITETVGVLYLAADTLVELARLGDTVQVVQFPQCGIGLSGVRPIYAPSIHWAAWGPYTIVSDSVAYRNMDSLYLTERSISRRIVLVPVK